MTLILRRQKFPQRIKYVSLLRCKKAEVGMAAERTFGFLMKLAKLAEKEDSLLRFSDAPEDFLINLQFHCTRERGNFSTVLCTWKLYLVCSLFYFFFSLSNDNLSF